MDSGGAVRGRVLGCGLPLRGGESRHASVVVVEPELGYRMIRQVRVVLQQHAHTVVTDPGQLLPERGVLFQRPLAEILKGQVFFTLEQRDHFQHPITSSMGYCNRYRASGEVREDISFEGSGDVRLPPPSSLERLIPEKQLSLPERAAASPESPAGPSCGRRSQNRWHSRSPGWAD